VSYFQEWIDGVVDIVGPRVTGVTIGSTLNSHDDYAVPSGHDPNGAHGVTAAQLRNVPIARPNQITISFSEDVVIAEEDLEVFGLVTSIEYHTNVVDFDYDDVAFRATWIFDAPLADLQADQVELRLSNVTDVAGVRLDGDWFNPLTTTDPNGSSFPSGDGSPDGENDFVFYLTFIPADFNLDNKVDVADYNIWSTNKFTGLHGGDGFLKGDATGDDYVDSSAFNIWNQLRFSDWTEWPGQQSLMSGGGWAPSSSWLDEYESLLDQFKIYRNGVLNQALTLDDWEAFTMALDRLFAGLS
jgi:hypothetical protein